VPTRYRIKTYDLPEVIKVPAGIKEVGLENFSVGIIRHPDEWMFSGDIAVARDTRNPPIVHDLWQTTVLEFTNLSDGWVYNVQSYLPNENIGRYPSNAMTGKRFGNYEVEILNEAISLKQCRNITLKNLRFRNAQVDDGSSNGYAVRVQGNDNLFDHVVIEKCKKAFCLYDSWTSGNVIKDCVSRDSFASPDIFHWRLAMANLVDNHSLDGPWWNAATQSLDSSSGQGHGSTQCVFWNTRGLRRPDTGIMSTYDRDNDRDGIIDSAESHGEIDDVALVISNQYDWGYIIGTYGSFSKVLTPKIQRGIKNDFSHPATSPVDHSEGIGYDASSLGPLEPRSLYEAQLALRLGKPTGDDKLTEVIVDNGQPGTSSTGPWMNSTGSNPYGGSSLYGPDPGSTYTFTTLLPETGRYEVYLWWTVKSTRLPNVPVEILHAMGSDVVEVNQLENGGRWNLLGAWDFESTATITIQSLGNGSTCADAVRLVKPTEANLQPEATIESITPNPASSGVEVLFNGKGSDPDGRVAAFRWHSSLDGQLSELPAFSTSSLSSGLHTISFSVQDDHGLWSREAHGTLEVGAATANPVVLDNGGPGTSYTGSWKLSGGTDFYGTSSLYSNQAGATYTFRPTLPGAGRYDVYLWWTEYSSRVTAVPVSIVHSAGTDVVYVNQHDDGSQWNLLGTWEFGTTATVTIRSLGIGSTCADALQLVPAGMSVPLKAVERTSLLHNVWRQWKGIQRGVRVGGAFTGSRKSSRKE